MLGLSLHSSFLHRQWLLIIHLQNFTMKTPSYLQHHTFTFCSKQTHVYLHNNSQGRWGLYATVTLTPFLLCFTFFSFSLPECIFSSSTELFSSYLAKKNVMTQCWFFTSVYSAPWETHKQTEFYQCHTKAHTFNMLLCNVCSSALVLRLSVIACTHLSSLKKEEKCSSWGEIIDLKPRSVVSK